MDAGEEEMRGVARPVEADIVSGGKTRRVARTVLSAMAELHHSLSSTTTSMSSLTLPPDSPPASAIPLHYALALYPGFQALDVFGPMDVLNVLSYHYPLSLSIVAKSLDPVSTRSPQGLECKGSTMGQSVVPTHTFADPPKDVDVLVIPGGIGNRLGVDSGGLEAWIEVSF